MCSLSWLSPSPQHYTLFFNRDEKKTRGVALPPRWASKDGTKYLAPVDPDRGGTWLAVNEFGLGLALLNYWSGSEEDDSAGSTTRGELPLKWIHLHTAAAVMKRLEKTDFSDYRPFTLAMFDLSRAGPLVIRWTGQEAQWLKDVDFLSSSSYLPKQIVGAREQMFRAAQTQTAEERWAWHCGTAEEATAMTPRMNRGDAQTWSISRVTVSREGLEWLYLQEMPGLESAAVEHRVSLNYGQP